MIVWAAVRFGARVVVLEQIVFAMAVTLYTAYGSGPFSPVDGTGNGTQHAQLYLICLVLIGLPLAKAMQQHGEALTKVQDSERTFRRNFTESRVPVAIAARGSPRVEHARRVRVGELPEREEARGQQDRPLGVDVVLRLQAARERDLTED